MEYLIRERHMEGFGIVFSGFREIQSLALPLMGTYDIFTPRIPHCDGENNDNKLPKVV